jgi:hypothetical protein
VTIEVPLCGGLVALVDDEDKDLVSAYSWAASPGKNTIYAKAWVRGTYSPQKNVYLHRLILNAPRGIQVDHKNRDGLDCRRENIRFASNGQNTCNASKHRVVRGNPPTSRFKGVTLKRNCRTRVWRASINADGNLTELGSFDHEEDAARAYDFAAVRLFGDFARLNFPDARRELVMSEATEAARPAAVQMALMGA